MGTRIATCICGIEFFDTSMEATTCNRCKASRKERDALIGKWKRKIAEYRETGNFAAMLNWNIIQMFWREGLTIPEIAEVLSFTECEVKIEIDIAKQNAR